MSHIAVVKCVVRDLDALDEAAAKLDAVLVRDARRFKSYGGGACEHLVRLNGAPGAYEVGLVSNAEVPGSWSFAYDSWGPGAVLEQRFGVGLQGLQNEYLAAVFGREARRMGAMVQRSEEGPRLEMVAYL